MSDKYVPTGLELTIASMMGIFKAYAGKDGDSSRLSNAELKCLLTKELPGYLQNANDSAAIEKEMKNLDEDGDGQVDFKEFIIFIAALTAACYDAIEAQASKSPVKK
uniref:Protein S100-P-like n=1 Tax=Petromyzon marinus TaxID=7757 RepID=A0AAJ7WTM3_PETMA|nr:protein S100-P-like [Petromyzon marinus]